MVMEALEWAPNFLIMWDPGGSDADGHGPVSQSLWQVGEDV